MKRRHRILLLGKKVRYSLSVRQRFLLRVPGRGGRQILQSSNVSRREGLIAELRNMLGELLSRAGKHARLVGGERICCGFGLRLRKH